MTKTSEAKGLERNLMGAAVEMRTVMPALRESMPGLDVYFFHRPMGTTTADFCEILASSGHETMIAIGDASGKGASAALYAMLVQSRLRALALSEQSPAKLLAQLDVAVKELRTGCEYATLLLSMWRPESGRFVIASAGAPAPAVLHNGQLEWVHPTGPCIGSPTASGFEQIDLPVAPGDLVVLCSDGISDQGGDQEGHYGDHRLAETIRKAGQYGVEQVAHALLADLDQFRAGTEQCDDQTIVVIRVT